MNRRKIVDAGGPPRTTLVIRPNQLFAREYIMPDITHIILHEHPHYFTKYKYNRIKLVLHRASMKLYAKYLEEHKFEVQYIDHNKSFREPANVAYFYQPDKATRPRINAAGSPNFLCLEYFEEYRAHSKSFIFANFYNWMRRRLDIIPDIASRDKYNRDKIPSDKKIPPPYAPPRNAGALAEAVAYVRQHFPKNPGPEWDILQETWAYPLTYKAARASLEYFVKHLFANFGKYQDFMLFGHDTTYHSRLSAAINIGLIHPTDIVSYICESSGKNISSSSKNINSIEGYIRQLFWREYQLYCYTYCPALGGPPKSYAAHHYPASKKLTRAWYHSFSRPGAKECAATGIEPLDLCINKAFATGYLHHIERLMVVGNYMLLSGVSPKAGFAWFMEFAADSYEWVMCQNVLDMVFRFDHTMRRVYISTSRYLLGMSNLKKGKWCDEWDKLYKDFLRKNKGKVGYPYEKIAAKVNNNK